MPTGREHRGARLVSAARVLLPALLVTTALAGAFLLVPAAGCSGERAPAAADPAGAPSGATFSLGPNETVFMDTLQARTFRFFWDTANPRTGLVADRWPTPSFASIAATGFALTAYGIGAERGYVTRDQAARRVERTLQFLWTAKQGPEPKGCTGYHGLFYHFLVPETGVRFQDVELSTMDSALLFAGALFCQSYFDRQTALEDSIRALADSLYRRADWQWASPRPPAVGHGWTPEEKFLPYDWRGYNEAMILYILALGSPAHPAEAKAWDEWLSTYKWGSFFGQETVSFAPLFGHQYTQVWVDLRGVRDRYMKQRGTDYFEISRRAVLAQHAYALANPNGWKGYGPRLWGLTACDGPANGDFPIEGRRRHFETYWARGAAFTAVRDDGTVCPSAVAGSIVFAPELVVPTLLAMRDDYGERLFSKYGFLDALNPTFKLQGMMQSGVVDPQLGWFDTDYLGIDQGPILAMIENWRTGLVWRVMRGNPAVINGMLGAGFTGGWLDSVTTRRAKP